MLQSKVIHLELGLLLSHAFDDLLDVVDACAFFIKILLIDQLHGKNLVILRMQRRGHALVQAVIFVNSAHFCCTDVHCCAVHAVTTIDVCLEHG